MRDVIPHDGMEEGIYLNLPASVYHSDPSLGSTDIRRLLVGPSEFQYYWSGNPDRVEKEDTEAMTLGRAFHLLVLEGRQSFDAAFACKPEGPDVLSSAEDLKGWLRAHGMNDKGVKDVLADRIRAVNPHVVIADKVLADHAANGRTVLPFESYQRVLKAAEHITSNPNLAQAFSGGLPEVSVFFIKNGIRLKARFDHLKVIRHEDRRCALISDLKSSRGPKPGQALDRWVTEVAAYNRIQAAMYLDALKAAKRFASDGLVHGGEPNGTLSAVASYERSLFAYVVLKSMGAPFADARLISPENPIVDISNRQIEGALQDFRTYFERFGPGLPWVSIHEPHELSIEEIPPWLL